MGLTRREFLQRAGMAAGAGMLGPGLFTNPFVRAALAGAIGDRYLVSIFLDGGNDGLNTVTPVDNGGGGLRTAYEAARATGVGGLRLTPDDLAATPVAPDPGTGAQLALHPALAGLKELYDLGKVAIVQGCGYPRYSLSHEESRMIWQTARPLTGAGGDGWIGRWLAANYGGTDIPAVSIARGVGGELEQSATSVLGFSRVRNLRFPYDGDMSGDIARKRDAFFALATAAGAQAQTTMSLLGDGALATLLSSERYPALDGAYTSARPSWNQAYDAVDSGVARDLREVAKIILGVETGAPSVTARCFRVGKGGYDTHSDQGAAAAGDYHAALHRELGDALRVFYEDCADMGVADRLCIIVWSEFSRRVPQNENGTDHGSQGPVFVIGGSVGGGVYGNHPNIDDAALDSNGNTAYSQAPGAFRSTDIRDVYGTILKHWLNMPAPTILAGVLTPDGGDPTTRWTSPNFDLPFLI